MPNILTYSEILTSLLAGVHSILHAIIGIHIPGQVLSMRPTPWLSHHHQSLSFEPDIQHIAFKLPPCSCCSYGHTRWDSHIEWCQGECSFQLIQYQPPQSKCEANQVYTLHMISSSPLIWLALSSYYLILSTLCCIYCHLKRVVFYTVGCVIDCHIIYIFDNGTISVYRLFIIEIWLGASSLPCELNADYGRCCCWQ